MDVVMGGYREYLESKKLYCQPIGLDVVPELSPMLFDFQRDITSWALRRGSAAIFADCGMGKTPMQLEWARCVPGRVIIVTPLAVAAQTCKEAEKFGVGGVGYMRNDDGATGIVVTNYEMLHNFEPSAFSGIVLDESSILKSYTGKFRNMLIDQWGGLRFKLAATATPAPNDFMELGNHSEFLGSMSRTEMLASFFVHDGGETQKWRLKGHAESEFWRWMCSWAVMVRKPSDLGYDDGDFILPSLNIRQSTTHANVPADGMLFQIEAQTMQERRAARRASMAARVAKVASLVNETGGYWLVWCDLNAESEMLASSIPGAVEVRGSDDHDVKSERLRAFSSGDVRVLVTKPSIAGFGMNWQHCHNIAFTGLSDSYEQFYQSVRRCWRFGQTSDVDCWVVTDSAEGAVVKNIKRKELDSERMAEMMVSHMRDINSTAIRGAEVVDRKYNAAESINLPEFV